jgi:type II secretory ATPase GspE/PulE/Tfp pilus assembly ATPase PilB-like protein
MLANGIHRQFLANSLLGVVSQRLVRRLCRRCRMQIDVDDIPSFLEEARTWIPENEKPALFMPIGCEQCVDGYDQLTCVPEIMNIGSELRRAIADQVDFERLGEIAREAGLWTFRSAAQLRLASGLSTVEELVRVIPEEELSRRTKRNSNKAKGPRWMGSIPNSTLHDLSLS